MALAPLTFAPYLNWVNATDPANIPPATRKIDASDLLRYENALNGLTTRSNSHSTTIDAVVRGTGSAVTVRALPVATTARPSASTLGAGATIFDTTLKKPLWSTGTAWVDSTGTAV